MRKSFYSHGKLLITGEYLVLDGTYALAIPTQKGQWLIVEENDSKDINWKSIDEDGNCWFKTCFTIENSIVSQRTTTKECSITNTLLDILNSAKELNPNFLSQNKGYIITTKLEFHQDWGLGSSSTLINNISQWAQIDAFKLLEKSFGGSGYDIACAQSNTPILYKRNDTTPIVTEASFNPLYKDNLFFIYLNQKQNSKDSIKHYRSLPLKEFDKAEATIQEITNNILTCRTIEGFEKLIDLHEKTIATIIKTPTVKSRLFDDYPRSIKSLGGWGGDFILATGTNENMNYFKNKGYSTIIPYSEMIL